jgi:putative tryptophan/tyrosine transport system substrate-binding protein
MSKRIIRVVLCALLLPLSFSAEAQQAKLFRLGMLIPGSSAVVSRTNLEAFQEGLRGFGYIEGKNISFEYRFSEGKNELLPKLAKELIALNVDVIVAASATAARGAKQATTTIPIVMIYAGDPIENGLVASLARPGGNVTGTTSLSAELIGKRLELLKETAPKIKHVGVLLDGTGRGTARGLEDVQRTAEFLELKIRFLEVTPPNADLIEDAFQKVTKERLDGLVIGSGPRIALHRKRILELANKSRLPVIYPDLRWTDDGGLISYAANIADQFRRSAYFVDKILKGAKPADLPVQQPTKFELVVNLKTAKQIGVIIPDSVLFQADKVIK